MAGGEQRVSEQSLNCRSPLLPMAPHHLHYRLNHPPQPRPWKNCLPRNRSLVPERLGTAGLEHNLIKILSVWFPLSGSVLIPLGLGRHFGFSGFYPYY